MPRLQSNNRRFLRGTLRRFQRGEIQHRLFLGISQSGKSTLAKARAFGQACAGRMVIVFCPTGEPWPCYWQTPDADEFIEVFWKNTGCAAYIEEAGVEFFEGGAVTRQRSKLATRGRHNLHELSIITQHYRSLVPAVREQAVELWCCTQGASSSEALAEEWSDRRLLEAERLPRGRFLHKPGKLDPAELRSFDLEAFCARHPDFREFIW